MINLIYFRAIVLKVLCLGFASGLPIAMTASTIQAYLYDNGISFANIGLFSLASIPYSLKFVWAPLLDNIKIPFICNLMGRRRSWIIILQILLMISFYIMGIIDVIENLSLFAFTVFIISFLSASQDIVIDALRIEMLEEDEQGVGIAATMLGYRLGMLTSGAAALYIAHYYGWHTSYLFVTSAMIIGIITTLICKEPQYKPSKYESAISWLKHSFVQPFIEFANRKEWWNILLFVALFKMSDAFAGVMTNTFLFDIGFTKKEIAEIVKLYGIIATLLGFFIGGILVKKISYYHSLFWTGILQMISNLVFIAQDAAGHNVLCLIASISIENLSSGLSSAALVGYISHICNREFTATQYALLSSMSSLARSTLASSSGSIAELYGWSAFFMISSVLTIPSLYFLRSIFKQDKQNAN